MRKPILIVLVIVALMIGLPPIPASGHGKWSKWVYFAPVKIQQPDKRGVTEFRLTPEVIDLSLPNLNDLRLLGNNGEKTGYVVQESKGRSSKKLFTVKIYNRSYVPGKHSSVTLDFGSKHIKNAVKLTTHGMNFRRKVRIEGSDNGESWQVIRDGAFLFRAREADAQGATFDKDVVRFPDNDQRYLRVTVYNDVDDPESVKIEDVGSWRQVSTPAETAEVPVVSMKTEEKKKVTEIILDLGFRNMPLYRLTLAVSNRNFFRHVEIAGRNAETKTIKTVVEDSPKFEKTVPVRWEDVTRGTIFRFTTKSEVEESLDIALKGSKYRYLRVRIKNYDDPSLQVEGATVTRVIQYLRFAGDPKIRYALYFGNLKAPKPKYDVERYIAKLRRDGTNHAVLGSVIPNPTHKASTKTLPWSERHRKIIWVALVAMLAVLSFVVYRIAVSAKDDASKAQP